MKVYELINELKSYSQNADIYYINQDGNCSDIKTQLFGDGNIVFIKNK